MRFLANENFPLSDLRPFPRICSEIGSQSHRIKIGLAGKLCSG